jgi:hypothetical protein
MKEDVMNVEEHGKAAEAKTVTIIVNGRAKRGAEESALAGHPWSVPVSRLVRMPAMIAFLGTLLGISILRIAFDG